MASNITFGATVVPSTNDENGSGLLPHPVSQSPALTPAASHESFSSGANFPPSSPFYEHPPASHEVSHSRHNSDNKINTQVFEKDVESGNVTPLSGHEDDNPFHKNHGLEENKECSMWPSRQTLQQKSKEQRKIKRAQNGFTGAILAPVRDKWSTSSKKQRLLVKIAVALFLVGVAVAIGVGISVAVRGTYYVADGSSKHIGR